jgi:hypothetical protein
VRIFRFVDFEELWPLTLGLFDKFSPQIRLIRTFLDRYNKLFEISNGTLCKKYRVIGY